MKILIVKPSSFGDIVQALPVAMGLRQYWPDAEIHWLAFEVYASLLRDHPALNRVMTIPRRGWRRVSQWRNGYRWVQALRAERYDIVLDLQGLLRSGLITWLTGAPRRIGLWGSREGSVLFYNEKILDPPPPAYEKYLEFLRYLGIRPEPHAFGLHPPPLAVTALEQMHYVVLHPYSRWRTKLWPWRYYDELMRAMPEQKFVMVGEGPWFPISAPNHLDLRNKLPLPQLMATLQHAQAVVSTDSGPAHLAAALDRPTVVIFGATDWRKTRPGGRQVFIERYAVPCSPCLKRTCPQRLPMTCLSEVKPVWIHQRLREILPKIATAAA